MKDKEDVFSKFRDSFSKIDGRFHILEQRVPVELQMEYFKYSEQIRKERNELTDIEYDSFVETLKDEETSTEYKRYVLSGESFPRIGRVCNSSFRRCNRLGIYGINGKSYFAGIGII